MKKYLVKTGGLYLSIVEAMTATSAWVKSVSNSDSEKFWDLEDARQGIIKMGFSKIEKTNIDGVFQIV